MCVHTCKCRGVFSFSVQVPRLQTWSAMLTFKRLSLKFKMWYVPGELTLEKKKISLSAEEVAIYKMDS